MPCPSESIFPRNTLYPGPCPPIAYPIAGGTGGGGYLDLAPHQVPVEKTALEKYQLRKLMAAQERYRARIIRDDQEVMEILATVLQSGILN